jgi:hypothetical protein
MGRYLVNKSDEWQHIFKRAVMPGGKVPLAEILAEIKHRDELAELKDDDIWEITLV